MNEIGKAVEAAMNQAPDVVSQLIIMERLDCVGWFIVMVIAMVGIFIAWKKSSQFDDETTTIARIVLSCIGFLIVIGLVSTPINFLATFIAPKAVAVKMVIRSIHK